MSKFTATEEQLKAVRRAMRSAHKRGLSDEEAAKKIAIFVGKRDDISHTISRQTYQRYRNSRDEIKIPIDKAKALFLFFTEGPLPILRGEGGVIDEGMTDQEKFIHDLSQRLNCAGGGFRQKDCQHLCYSYELYRKSWATTEPGYFIRSLVRFEKEGDAFVITENSKIPIGDEIVEEVDRGWLITYGTNVVAISNSMYCMKFYVIHDFYPALTVARPVLQFGGNYIAVSGDGPHPSFPFMARRTSNLVDIGHFHMSEIEPDSFQREFFAKVGFY